MFSLWGMREFAKQLATRRRQIETVGANSGAADEDERKTRNGETSQGLGSCAGERLSLTIELQMVRERRSPAQLPKPASHSTLSFVQL